MFTHYRALFKKIKVDVSCLRFFSLASHQESAGSGPIALFRLYDPYFAVPHFLPIKNKGDNKVFGWPQALMKSIRPEVECMENETVALNQELKEKEKKITPIDPFEKANHLITLANLHLELLNANKCEELLESALKILCSLDSLESAKLTSDAYQQLAITKQLKEEYSIAVTYYQEALKYSAKVFRGLHHPSQAQLYAMLGMAYAAVDQPAKFENCYQQIITSMKTCFSNSPNMWVDFESSLAVVYQRQGKYHEAILLHERCCQTYSKVKGERMNVPIEKINWAATLIEDNDFFQAKKLLVDAENVLAKWPLVNPEFFKIIATNLAICAQQHTHLPQPAYL